jgi:hypothetical protein
MKPPAKPGIPANNPPATAVPNNLPKLVLST